MTRTKRLFANLCLLTLGTVIGLVFLEIAARVLVSTRRPGKSGEQALYSDFDPVLGWRNRPGATVAYNRREYRTKVEINRLGFRDVERSVTKPPGKQRIVVLGDSFVEAYAVERDEGLTRRIEMLANEQGCPADVVNAGVHGYSIDQNFLWFERESEPLAPDVVLLAVYYNDLLYTIRENYWGSLKPVLETREGRLRPVNTPLPAPPPSTSEPRATPRPPRPIEGSALRGLLRERILVGAPRLYQRLGEFGLVPPYQPEAVSDELRVFKTRGLLGDIDAAWQRTAEIVEAFGKTARGRQTAPVLAYIPARFEVVDTDWELTQLTHALNPAAWDRNLVAQKLAGMAAASGIPFMNFAADLRRSSGGLKGSPYFQYDGHWNALGNDIAAKTAVAFLRKQGLLTCGDLAKR